MSGIVNDDDKERAKNESRSLLLDVIRPLCRVWEKGSGEMHEFKKHLAIFRCDAYPQLLKWTTYPINVAQRQLYEIHKKAMRTKSGEEGTMIPTVIPFYWNEIISMMDRCTAFAYTGSTKVVPKKLGTVFWFGTAVNTALLPCFNPKIVEFGGGEEGDWMRVCAAKWPFDDVMQRPLQSSGRTLELEYDVEFQQVSALVVIHHSSVVESEFFWEKISPLLLFLASFFVKRSRQSVEEYCFGEFFCQNISPWFEKLALDFFFFGLEFFFLGKRKEC